MAEEDLISGKMIGVHARQFNEEADAEFVKMRTVRIWEVDEEKSLRFPRVREKAEGNGTRFKGIRWNIEQ
jgi:hypothetical protein